MRHRELNGRALAAVAAVALGLGPLAAATAQTGTATARYGDSQSLSWGAPMMAPYTVDAGQQVNVVVEGAPQGARIELWGPVTESGRGGQLAASPLTGGTAALTAPGASGSYELRYVDGQGRLRGRQAFDVAAVPVALTVPTPVDRGRAMEVTWQGPARAGDRFEIVSASGAVVDATPIAGNPSARNVSQVTAPQESGTYELRYVTDRGAVLRWVRFDVR